MPKCNSELNSTKSAFCIITSKSRRVSYNRSPVTKLVCQLIYSYCLQISIDTVFPGATIFVLVFSIAERGTFYQLSELLKVTNEARKTVGASLALIGCKLDLEHVREINTSTAELLAGNLGGSYCECSAKTGEGTFLAFDR